MSSRRDMVLGALRDLGGERYSREVAEHVLPAVGGDLRNVVPWVQRELRALEADGVLTSRIVRPGPTTFWGGMLRRYYRMAGNTPDVDDDTTTG